MQMPFSRRPVVIAVLLLTAVSLSLSIAASALGTTPVSVTVQPPAQTVIAGDSFSLNVTVDNVTNLAADQATLHFEPQALQVVQITEGAFLRSAGTTIGAGMEIVNNSAGSLSFFYALTTQGIGVNGSGTLATIVFATNSSITNATALVTLADVILADADGAGIHVDEIASGTVTISAPAHPVFDTGRGSYPSISGIHNGTITPAITLNVSRLFSYSCPGTGGHTEYARLWLANDSWSIETMPWPGYTGDWHYLYFPQPVTLQANETYHYTIRTASYPELIHLPEIETAEGTITCATFRDANGNTHSGWIPAIRLE